MTCGVEQDHPRHEPYEQAKDAGTEQDDPAVLLQLLLKLVVLLPAGSEGEIVVFVGVHECCIILSVSPLTRCIRIVPMWAESGRRKTHVTVYLAVYGFSSIIKRYFKQ